MPWHERQAGPRKVERAGVVILRGPARLQPFEAVGELDQAIDVAPLGRQAEHAGDLCQLGGAAIDSR